MGLCYNWAYENLVFYAYINNSTLMLVIAKMSITKKSRPCFNKSHGPPPCIIPTHVFHEVEHPMDGTVRDEFGMYFLGIYSTTLIKLLVIINSLLI
jgi:hypothetical protein